MRDFNARFTARKPEVARNLKKKFRMKDFGVLSTLDRMNTSLHNFSEEMDRNKVFNIVDTTKRDFSTGVNDSANVTGVDIVDITLAGTIKSFIPAIAIDRGMSKPKDIVTYQKMVAMNDAGGVAKGTVVVNPFAPISPNLDLSVSGTTKQATGSTSTSGTFVPDFGPIAFPIAKKSIMISIDGKDCIGQDLNGDGIIYWTGADASSAVKVDSIDYESGIITFAQSTVATALHVDVSVDTTSERSGANTLRLKPINEDIVLEAQPNRISFEQSIENLARMNKQVIGANYGKVARIQVLNALVYFLNNVVVKVMYKMAQDAWTAQATKIEFDLSAYTVSSFASTKNDKLTNFMLQLQRDVMTKSNFKPNCYFVGNAGAIVLQNNEISFKEAENATQTLDGLIGYYNNVPVYTAQYITLQENADIGLSGETYAHVIALYRDPEGMTAPVMYGEFLPIYSSKAGINFDNPAEFAQVLFNQSNARDIVPQLITMGKIRLS